MKPTESQMIVDTWQLYSTEDFAILLPGIPQHISEKMPFNNGKELIKYDMYLVQQAVGSTFMVSVIRYPESYDTSDSRKILESVTNEMLSNNSENHLVSSKIGEYFGKPSMDNVIANPSLHVVMKAVLSNKTLFVFTVVDSIEDRAKEHFEKSMKEFRLLP